MATILFVHGTGSRELDYAAAIAKLQRNLPEHRVLPCLWGESVGARLGAGGASIPEYAESQPGKPPSQADVEKARWWMLYQDPLFELRLLEDRNGEWAPIPPTSLQPGEEAVARTKNLRLPQEFVDSLRRLGLEDHWGEAFAQVVEAAEFEQILVTANLSWLDTTRPIARALVASLIRCGEEKGIPSPVGAVRDALVEMLVPALGGTPLGLLSWGVGLFLSVAARSGGKWVRKNKRGVFDGHSNKIADIVHYQSRGGRIREFIRDRMAAAGPEVFVVCHSLGGIACVDLLAEQAVPGVKALVTAGSQAGFFYEIDALVGVEFGQALPSHFPPWENYYDPADFLSYKAAPLFPGKVKDLMVDNGQPFPESHSAYWDNRDVLAGIRRVIEGGRAG